MRYFLAFLTTLFLVFLLVFLLFHGGGKSKAPLTIKTLHSYASTDATVQMTIDGPVNAAQNHQQVRISVGRDDVTFEQLQGYDGNVTNTQDFSNTQNAYTAFLFSLARAGFSSGNNDPSLSDERGFCPLGERYVFQLTQDGKDIERYWATSCGGNLKTYLGAFDLTVSLFKAQVPNYSQQTQNFIL
jgi:hypothetical protein